ncbi:hypothetical protein LWI28_008004 [Acer negundo]|uniref:Uncharacterized protein n=1 Tax=Acer negundo TaxID=4023 RepID=A0AAD5IPH6_ACENE|nr:hypothetical protein LWI28_008004 [Acer negundo]
MSRNRASDNCEFKATNHEAEYKPLRRTCVGQTLAVSESRRYRGTIQPPYSPVDRKRDPLVESRKRKYRSSSQEPGVTRKLDQLSNNVQSTQDQDCIDDKSRKQNGDPEQSTRRKEKSPMRLQLDPPIIDLNEPILTTDVEANPANLSIPYGI